LHRYGRTALHYAFYGPLPAVRALINAGAPLHIQDNDRWAFCGADRRGRARETRGSQTIEDEKAY
jgi:hypothetical protein